MAAPQALERDRLVGHFDAYLDALVANDPTAVPVEGARFTENGQRLAFGRGLWGTATAAPAHHRALLVADPVNGQVAGFAVVSEAGEPVLLGLRLRIVGEAITEAETLVSRDRETIFSLEGMHRPRPRFEELVDPEERTSRADLARVPDRYLDGILTARGASIGVADDCIRIENGVQTVLNPTAVGIRAEARDRGTWHLGVAAQVDAGIFEDIESARDRRVTAIDEERGLVFVNFFFDHAGPLASRGGRSRFRTPNSMMAAEVFKVVGGQIREIEAIIDVFPYGMASGWS